MNGMTYVKRAMITAVCIALCVVLPMVFHAIPNSGIVLSPMHIPVLLCGLICGAPFGVLCGLAGPLLSNLLTGMPIIAFLPAMMIELAVYGALAGLMMQVVHTSKIYADLYISLIVAMFGGRVIAGITKALIFAKGHYTLALWATGYFVTTLPGIVIHLALIPTIVVALEKARLIPTRYPNK